MERKRERKKGGWAWAGYDHLFSRDSPKAERERELGWDLWDCGDGDPRKMDRPNVGQITFFSGGTKTTKIGQRRGRNGQKPTSL